MSGKLSSRMWSGFSSEIETHHLHIIPHDVVVACGAASRLRLKRLSIFSCGPAGEVACGAASRLRLKLATFLRSGRVLLCRMWSGFSSEIETMGEYGMKPGL